MREPLLSKDKLSRTGPGALVMPDPFEWFFGQKFHHIRPYYIILYPFGAIGQCWTILDNVWTILDNFGLFWTVLKHSGIFGTILEYFGSFLPSLNILDNFGPFWVI